MSGLTNLYLTRTRSPREARSIPGNNRSSQQQQQWDDARGNSFNLPHNCHNHVSGGGGMQDFNSPPISCANSSDISCNSFYQSNSDCSRLPANLLSKYGTPNCHGTHCENTSQGRTHGFVKGKLRLFFQI